MGQSRRAKLAGIKQKRGRKKSLRETKRTNSLGMLRGRPRKWNRAKVVKEVCDRIAEGELVVGVCKDIGIKHLTLMTFIEESDEFKALYATARRMQSHAIAQRGMLVARGKDAVSLERKRAIKEATKHWKKKDPRNWRQRVEKLKHGLIARNRLELDATKWYTRITNPREFGEKVDVTSGGEKLPQSGPQHLTVSFVATKKKGGSAE